MSLTDAQWARIEPLLPDRTPKRGGLWRDRREVMDIAFKFRTGTQWVYLPEKYGNWRGVYKRLLSGPAIRVPYGRTSWLCTPAVHGRPIEYLDVHDPAVHDVQDQHAFRRRERHTPMARAVRLSPRMICRPDALAKVIAAAALVNQTQIPRADCQLAFSFILQEGGQLGDEIWEDFADEGVVLLHGRRVAGAAG
ncbi:transposase [Streptomyces sp. NPDC002659]|uniref:transposase n=1 Tax=Streptomyces sp. NPDC002659 TaxID=3364656 RepID=UPI0036C739F0